MADTERLLLPIETTTLWANNSTGQLQLVASSLQHAGNPDVSKHEDTTLAPPAPPTPPTFVDTDQRSHRSLLHVIKRRDRYVVTIDGGEAPKTVFGLGAQERTVYAIQKHHGLHTDPEATGAIVFSPCAVVVSYEDGVVPPQRCMVRHWQQMGGRIAGDLIGKRELVADVEVEATALSNHLFDVVHLPFPLPRSRQPRIEIADIRKLVKFQFKELKQQLSGGWGKQLEAAVRDTFEGKDPSKIKKPWAFLAVSARSASSGQSEQARNAFSNFIAEVGFQSLIAVPVLLGVMSDSPLGIILGKSASDALAMALQPNVSAEARRNAIVSGAINGALMGILSYFVKTPPPDADTVYMTLDELASTLETLAALTNSKVGGALNESLQANKFTKEGAVFSWLMNAGRKSSRFTFFTTDNTGGFSANTASTTQFWDAAEDKMPSQPVHLQTSISIRIDDPSACLPEADLEFEFVCKRDDAYLMGLASQGFLSTVQRLEDAIASFKTSLTKAIRASWSTTFLGDVTGSRGYAAYWWDTLFWNPAAKFIWDTAPGATQRNQSELKKLGIDRAAVLRAVYRNVQEKLVDAFVIPTCNVQKLRSELIRVVQVTSIPTTVQVAAATWIRSWPHRAGSSGYLFNSVHNTKLDSFDVHTQENIIREFTALHDAVVATNEVFRQERVALGHLMKTWESSDRRLILKTGHDALTPTSTFASLEVVSPPESYALVFQLPPDVADASTAIDETSRRAMRIISDRRTTSVLRGISSSLPDNEIGFVSLQFFAELWASELYRLGAQDNQPATFARSVLETASARACRRSAACAAFVLGTTQQKHMGFFGAADPALLAKQSGRDAASLSRRLRVFEGASNVRIGYVRAVAKILSALASSMQKDAGTNLPSEPLQAFFMDPASGHYAYARCLTVVQNLNRVALGNVSTSLSNVVISSASAAYPALLLPIGEHPTTLGRARGNPPAQAPVVPTRPPDVDDATIILKHLQLRAALLRMDVPSCETIHPGNGTVRSVDDITTLFASFDVNDAQKQLSQFYVPFGFGEPPPALKASPISAIMLGSVPLWTDDVVANVASLLQGIRGTSGSSAPVPARRAVILPTVACTEARKAISAPAIINVTRDPAGAETLVYAFYASEFATAKLQSIPKNAPADAPDAASQFRQDADAQAVSDGVCELAWNAERVLQCILLSFAQDEAVPLEIQLDLVDAKFVALVAALQNKIDFETQRTVDCKDQFMYDMTALLVEMRTLAEQFTAERIPITLAERRQYGTMSISTGVLGDNEAADAVTHGELRGLETNTTSSTTGALFTQPDAQSQQLPADLRALTDDDIDSATLQELTVFHDNYRVILQELRQQIVRDVMANLDTDLEGLPAQDINDKLNVNETFIRIERMALTATAALSAYEAAKRDLDALILSYTATQDAHTVKCRALRRRLVAATVVGAALGRALLGQTHAPRATELKINGAFASLAPAAEKQELDALLANLKEIFDTPNTPNNVLRFSEVCAITYATLCSA